MTKFSATFSAAEMKALWAEVKANRARIEACPRHRFTPLPVSLGLKVTCEVCGGSVSLTDLGEYIRGYEAAGRSADDIWPGFRATKDSLHD